MRGLIRADLRRILKKKSLYVWVFLMVLFFVLSAAEDTAADQLVAYRSGVDMAATLFAVIPIFLGLFGDEQKAGSMQIAIGRGLSRKKAVLAKFIEAMILLIIFFAILIPTAFAWNAFMEVIFSARQARLFLLYLWTGALRAWAFLAISMVFAYLTGSVAVGMFALILPVLFSKTLLTLAQAKLDIPFYDMFSDGLRETAYSRFAIGSFGWQIIPLVVFYIVLPYCLCVLIFRKKELSL